MKKRDQAMVLLGGFHFTKHIRNWGEWPWRYLPLKIGRNLPQMETINPIPRLIFQGQTAACFREFIRFQTKICQTLDKKPTFHHPPMPATQWKTGWAPLATCTARFPMAESRCCGGFLTQQLELDMVQNNLDFKFHLQLRVETCLALRCRKTWKITWGSIKCRHECCLLCNVSTLGWMLILRWILRRLLRVCRFTCR